MCTLQYLNLFEFIYFVHGYMVLPCVPACLFNMSDVVCEYMYIQDGHYAKAQRLSTTISVAVQGTTSEGNSTLSHGQQRDKVAL